MAGRWVDGWSGAALAAAVAGVARLVAVAMGWRGSDLPAQLFRAELFRRDGFVLWNGQWFSGTPTLDYSVLSPALSALTGPVVLCMASGALSAFLFHRLAARSFGAAAWVGSLWFATSTVTNLIVGRVVFGLGVTFMLGALLALQRHRAIIAVVCALLCALASPVAGSVLRDRGLRVGAGVPVGQDRGRGHGRGRDRSRYWWPRRVPERGFPAV